MALHLGQRLRRREPVGDEWDTVIIRGFADSSEAHEPVISPSTFGEAIAVHPPSLLQHYTLAAADDNNPGAEIAAGLAKLNDKPWESEPGEPISG